MLHAFLPCDVIHSKEYGDGVIFVLNLSKQTRIATIDKQMKAVDADLRQRLDDDLVHFTRISDVLCGMFKTFGKDEHERDEHCKAIFSGGVNSGKGAKAVNAGVKVWTPSGGVEERTTTSKRSGSAFATNNDGPAKKARTVVVVQAKAVGNSGRAMYAEMKQDGVARDLVVCKQKLDSCMEELEKCKQELGIAHEEIGDVKGELVGVEEVRAVGSSLLASHHSNLWIGW